MRIATLRCLLDWFSIWDFGGFQFVKPKVHTAPEPACLRAVFLTGNGNNFSSPAHQGHSLPPLFPISDASGQSDDDSLPPFFCQHPKMSDFTIWLVTSVLIAACFKDNNIFAALIFPFFFSWFLLLLIRSNSGLTFKAWTSVWALSYCMAKKEDKACTLRASIQRDLQVIVVLKSQKLTCCFLVEVVFSPWTNSRLICLWFTVSDAFLFY